MSAKPYLHAFSRGVSSGIGLVVRQLKNIAVILQDVEKGITVWAVVCVISRILFGPEGTRYVWVCIVPITFLAQPLRKPLHLLPVINFEQGLVVQGSELTYDSKYCTISTPRS